MNAPTFVTLHPHRWTPVPGTRLLVRWDGEEAVDVRVDGVVDLSPLVRPGKVLAWVGIAGRPGLGAWPLVPLPRRTTYRCGP